MKSRILLAAAFVAVASSLSAVPKKSSKPSKPTAKTEKIESGYNKVYVQCLAAPANKDINLDEGTKILSMKSYGFAMGYARGFNVSNIFGKNLPLYVEAGANIRYIHGFDSETIKHTTYDLSANSLSFQIPVNITYKFKVGSVHIDPFVGVHLTINALSKCKLEEFYCNTSSNTAYTTTYDINYLGETLTKTSTKQGSADKTYNFADFAGRDDRYEKTPSAQFGMQFGCGVDWRFLYGSLGYLMDFGDYATYVHDNIESNVKVGGLMLTVGARF